jgi:hypothetical protein
VKLATIRVGGATRAVRADGDLLTDLGATDLGEFLAGETVVTEIKGAGRLENRVVKDTAT